MSNRNIYLIRHGHRENFGGDSEQINEKWALTADNRFNLALSLFGHVGWAWSFCDRCILLYSKGISRHRDQTLWVDPFSAGKQYVEAYKEWKYIKGKLCPGIIPWQQKISLRALRQIYQPAHQLYPLLNIYRVSSDPLFE